MVILDGDRRYSVSPISSVQSLLVASGCNLIEQSGNRMHLPALHLPYQSLAVILLILLSAFGEFLGW
jgi:hypothetical protein